MCRRSRLSNRIHLPRSEVWTYPYLENYDTLLFNFCFFSNYIDNIDLHFRCIEKPDPCNPSPCGPGTMCMANKFGNPICRCLGKLVPKPDTITGCGPECTVRNAFIFDYHKYSLLNKISKRYCIIDKQCPKSNIITI